MNWGSAATLDAISATLWAALMAAGRPYGIMPTGLLALDMARLEAGLMLIDVDYVPARKALISSQLSSPYELDLAWGVNELNQVNALQSVPLKRRG